MSLINPKVLVVATSKKTRGGITSVVKAHETGQQWETFKCRWIETHKDGRVIIKLFLFIKSFIQYLSLLPFYQIVHIHVASPPSLFRKYFFLIPAILFRKKIISHFHPPGPDVLDGKNKKWYKIFFKNSTKVLVLSSQWQRWLKEYTDIDKNTEILYNPCPRLKGIAYQNRKKYCLFAGTIIERKGYAHLIKAFAAIAEKFPDWQIKFAGNGEIEQGKSLAKKLKIENQIIFEGWVKGEKKVDLFKNAAVYCLCSSGEGFPMSVLEAWAYEIPVICTPVGGLPDVAIHGENALLYNYGDIKTLSENLELIFSNEKLRQKISLNSKKLADSQFNIDTINNQLQQIYLSVLAH